MTEPDEVKTHSPPAMSHPALLQHDDMAKSVTDLNHKVTQQKLTINTALRSSSLAVIQNSWKLRKHQQVRLKKKRWKISSPFGRRTRLIWQGW